MAQYGSFQGSGQQPHYEYQQSGYGNGPSMAKRLLLLGGIIVFVIVIIIVFFNVVVGGDDGGPEQDLGRINQRQSRIITLIDEYESDVRSADTQNRVAIINSVMISDQQTLRSIGATGIKPTSVTDSGIDDRLMSAAASTDFDRVFETVLTTEIEANIVDLQAVLAVTTKESLNEALNTALTNQTALIN